MPSLLILMPICKPRGLAYQKFIFFVKQIFKQFEILNQFIKLLRKNQQHFKKQLYFYFSNKRTVTIPSTVFEWFQ